LPLKFTASVPGELRFRDLVGSMVRAVCLRVERDAGCAGLEWRLMSAYNEAFNNIVEHAYAVDSGRGRGGAAGR
jgi:anti-sigma regulatory factor (Ser/Thr protein kinase)